MTSNPPAEPRPPPSISLVSGLPRTPQTRTAPKILTQQQPILAERSNVEGVDGRSVKKRKVSQTIAVPTLTESVTFTEHHPASSAIDAKYTGASWLSIVQSAQTPNGDGQGGDQKQPQSLPDRPWGPDHIKPPSLEEGRPDCRVRHNTAVPTTPDSMTIPTSAPLLEDKRRADYFPWSGNHQEDVLSDVHVKQGYFDRAPNPPEKELNTAKPTLYNAFKHRSGLENLSALISLVLDQKNSHGTFSSGSSFKGPPPRVTLTEAKRKSWIADLASTEVPLRRLSKTIPQGIRGQSLLDQCLLHFVPLSRAIWFAKCVGANEIRTLRRKGVTSTVASGAEAKWLREWTINIEQSIESVLSHCGTDLWKKRILYATQLATRLYQDNLVDRDHYLDWIVKSFSAAPTDCVPFWLMMVNLHRADVISYRKRGKQLAESLISKYNLFKGQDTGHMEPLLQRLSIIIRSCVSSQPVCFLMPDKWLECEKALSSCLDTTTSIEKTALDRIRTMNTRVLIGSNNPTFATSRVEDVVVELLDSVIAPFDMLKIGESLSKVCSDQNALITTCIAWCVSRYRVGTTRIYLIARVLRHWAKNGYEVESTLFKYIFKEAKVSHLNLDALRHLFSELSRSRTFSTSKYLQWLSVRGWPRRSSYQDQAMIAILKMDNGEMADLPSCNDPLQLVAEVSLFALDTHVQNARNVFLTRSGFDCENEVYVLQACKEYCANRLEQDSASLDTKDNRTHFSELPWSMRTQLSHWLRQEVINMVRLPRQNGARTVLSSKPHELTCSRFGVIRDVLEQMQDIAILADVLRVVAYQRQEDLLATAVDTINMHSPALSAIGALESLQQLYCQAYLTMRPLKLSMPLLATALIDFCSQYPAKVTPTRALQQDFVRGDRGRAIAACSPFSDGVAESLQQAGATFYDDFEAILQTESNMNEQTMSGLFVVLTDRIVKKQSGLVEDGQESFILCQLLCRLKSCRKLRGEVLMKNWLSDLMSRGDASSSLFVELISTRCISLIDMVEMLQLATTNTTWSTSLHNLLRHVVHMNYSPEGVNENLWYSFRLGVAKLGSRKPAELFEIMAHASSDVEPKYDATSALVAALVANPDSLKYLSKSGRTVLSRKLFAAFDEVETSAEAPEQARSLARAANVFSLPYCQFRMRMLCQNSTVNDDEDIQQAVADSLSTALDGQDLTFQSPSTVQALLRSAGPAISTRVQNNAEQLLYNALPKFLQNKAAVQLKIPIAEENDGAMIALRRVITVNTDGLNPNQTSSISTLVEKLTIYLRCLGMSSTVSGNVPSSPIVPVTPVGPTSFPVSANPESSRTFLLASLDSLKVLMQMILVKRPMFSTALSQPSPATIKHMQQEQIKLTGIVISIATHVAWSTLCSSGECEAAHRSTVRNMTSTLLDIAATLVDDMADETRQFCARILKDKTKDERVRWLLGSVNMYGSTQCPDAGRGLTMYHESKGAVGDFKVKAWEMLEGGGGRNDACLGLGLFGAKKV